MPDCARLACILLAAGESRRFGGNKLEVALNGKMLGLHAAENLAAMGFGAMVAVGNTRNTRLNPALSQLGFQLVINPDPSAGQAGSLALGVKALADSDWDGILVALADMPYVSGQHLTALVKGFANSGKSHCSSNGMAKMPPAIFARSDWPQLTGLSGDQGARGMLADTISIIAEAWTLKDIDFPDDIPAP